MDSLLLVGFGSPKAMNGARERVSKADYHGSLMTVTKSKSPSMVGITGIMIKETKFTFNIITKDDKLKGER